MSFSFLGYVHIEPISVTFVYIPVLVAGCVLGPKDAMIVGAVFGLASMWKASAYYVGAGDAIFSPVMSGKPLASILLSVGSRTLFGLIVGLLFYWAKRRCHPLPWILAVASVGRPIHTVLVYGVMEILFPEAGFGLSNIMADFMRGDFLPFIVIADEQDVTLDELYRDADRLLYEAKKNGKGQVAFGYRWDHYEAEP